MEFVEDGEVAARRLVRAPPGYVPPAFVQTHPFTPPFVAPPLVPIEYGATQNSLVPLYEVRGRIEVVLNTLLLVGTILKNTPHADLLVSSIALLRSVLADL